MQHDTSSDSMSSDYPDKHNSLYPNLNDELKSNSLEKSASNSNKGAGLSASIVTPEHGEMSSESHVSTDCADNVVMSGSALGDPGPQELDDRSAVDDYQGETDKEDLYSTDQLQHAIKQHPETDILDHVQADEDHTLDPLTGTHMCCTETPLTAVFSPDPESNTEQSVSSPDPVHLDDTTETDDSSHAVLDLADEAGLEEMFLYSARNSDLERLRNLLGKWSEGVAKFNINCRGKVSTGGEQGT